MERYIDFTEAHASVIVAHLRQTGIDPTARVVPQDFWAGGCSDPDCCAQHPSTTDAGEQIVAIEATLPQHELAQIAAQLGLDIAYEYY